MTCIFVKNILSGKKLFFLIVFIIITNFVFGQSCEMTWGNIHNEQDTILFSPAPLQIDGDTVSFETTGEYLSTGETVTVSFTGIPGGESVLFVDSISYSYDMMDDMPFDLTNEWGKAWKQKDIFWSNDWWDLIFEYECDECSPDSTYIIDYVCENEETGTAVDTLQNVLGCDSIVTTESIFDPIVYIALDLYTCDSNEAGIFLDTVYTVSGCIDTMTTSVVWLSQSSVTILDTLGTCNPFQQDSIMILSGVSCDSMVIQPYEYLGSNETTVTLFTCEQGEVGISVTTLLNHFGCDSIVTQVTQLYPITNNITISDSIVCDIDLVRNDTIVETNQFGCSYFIIQPYVYEGVDITILPTLYTCIFDEAGVFQDTLSNHNGCDSIVITTVLLDPINISYLADSLVCDPALAELDTVMTTNPVTGCDNITIQALVATYIDISLDISDVSCNSNEDGQISLSVTSNDVIEEIFWSNGFDTEIISELEAGTYTVTVTSASSCEATETYSVSEPLQLDAEVVSTNPSCSANDGLIDIQGVGGTAPYTYVWEDGNTDHLRQDLSAGIYTVTVTDANGCTTTQEVTLEDTESIEITLAGTIVSCEDGNDGTVSATVTGGTGPYNFIWNNGATTEDISGLAPGMYSATVTDINGCTATTQTELICDGCSIWYANNKLFVKVFTGDLTDNFVVKVTIKDIAGRETSDTFAIDVMDGYGEDSFLLDNLDSGIYLAEATGGSIHKVTKFINQ